MAINTISPKSNLPSNHSVPKSPSPNVYHIASDFDNTGKKGTGFGEGREDMTITGPFMLTYKNKNPGPGNYEAKSMLSRTCYSMKGKNYVEDREKLKTPGPGSCTLIFIRRLIHLRLESKREVFFGKAQEQLC